MWSCWQNYKSCHPPKFHTRFVRCREPIYTNVPIQPTLTRLSEILDQCKILPPVADEFVSLLKACLKPNICQFNNKIFRFSGGLPMGFPIASTMADIFMDSLENEIFTSDHNLLPHVKYWFRYVDDILCLWDGSLTELRDFLSFINSFYSKIQFTSKLEARQ